jgi:aspartokinase/homoserine dehydrogenase 1
MYNSVFVDCTASGQVAEIYQRLIDNNVSVVTANKIFASGPYDDYVALKQSATMRGVKFLYETNVGAGLPVIGTIDDLVNSGDKILQIEAVLSGTLNFIFSNVARGMLFSEAVRRAHDEGYSEPDPRIDLSCGDVVRKIVILARECGYRLEQDEVEVEPLLPNTIFDGSIENFWSNITMLDDDFSKRSRELQAEGKRLQVVATVVNGKAKVSLQTIAESHPFSSLVGSGNAILLTTERYRHFPMLIQGYGAGADVTAAGVFANIMSVANI